MDKADFLKKVPLFRGVGDYDIESLASMAILKDYIKDQAVLREEDTSVNSMFVIVKGKIKVTVTGIDGKEAILAIMEKNEYFGEMSIIDGEPRSASVYAMEPTKLLMLKRRDLLSQIQNNPRLSLSMLVEFSKRLRQADNRISSLALLGVYGRIANIISELAISKGIKKENVIIIENRPTHQQLADMSGTTRETVSRVLGKLQKARKIIIEKNRIIILNPEELKYEE